MKTTTVILYRHAHKSTNLHYVEALTPHEMDKMRTLSTKGQEQAYALAQHLVDYKLDRVYSSHYVRAIETAAYVSEQRSLPTIIDSRFGERVKSIDPSVSVPHGYRRLQAINPYYKLDGGESRIDVAHRFGLAIDDILKEGGAGCVLVISHKNAILMYLMNFCEASIMSDGRIVLSYKGRVVFDGIWNGSPQGFRLLFKDNDLYEINPMIYV